VFCAIHVVELTWFYRGLRKGDEKSFCHAHAALKQGHGVQSSFTSTSSHQRPHRYGWLVAVQTPTCLCLHVTHVRSVSVGTYT
jgi:hypothetical protein